MTGTWPEKVVFTWLDIVCSVLGVKLRKKSDILVNESKFIFQNFFIVTPRLPQNGRFLVKNHNKVTFFAPFGHFLKRFSAPL